MHKEFLDNPPGWFQLVATFLPVLYLGAMWLIVSVIPVLGFLMCATYLLVLPGLFVFLVLSSRWFRSICLIQFVFWIFFGFPLTGLTQGAISASISKAFSAVESQVKATRQNLN